MEIYQLRAFVTVAKIGHLTRAAEALHVTQPAVTGQIKALEPQLPRWFGKGRSTIWQPLA